MPLSFSAIIPTTSRQFDMVVISASHQTAEHYYIISTMNQKDGVVLTSKELLAFLKRLKFWRSI